MVASWRACSWVCVRALVSFRSWSPRGRAACAACRDKNRSWWRGEPCLRRPRRSGCLHWRQHGRAHGRAPRNAVRSEALVHPAHGEQSLSDGAEPAASALGAGRGGRSDRRWVEAASRIDPPAPTAPAPRAVPRWILGPAGGRAGGSGRSLQDRGAQRDDGLGQRARRAARVPRSAAGLPRTEPQGGSSGAACHVGVCRVGVCHVGVCHVGARRVPGERRCGGDFQGCLVPPRRGCRECCGGPRRRAEAALGVPLEGAAPARCTTTLSGAKPGAPRDQGIPGAS